MFVKRYQEFLGVVLAGIAVFFLVAIAAFDPSDYDLLARSAPVNNIAGPVGAWIGYIVRSLFGSASYCIAGILALPGLYLIRAAWMRKVTEKTALLILMILSLSAVLSLFMGEVPQLSGGHAGAFISARCVECFGRTASYILLSVITIFMAIVLVILFLAPKREQYEITARFSGRMKNILTRIRFFFSQEDVPHLSIGQKKTGEGRRKYPWITKKRIIVYEAESPGSPLDVLPFPALPDSSWDRDYTLISDSKGESGRRLLEEPAEGVGDQDTEVVLTEGDYAIEKGEEAGDVEGIDVSCSAEGVQDGSHIENDSIEESEYDDEEMDGDGPVAPAGNTAGMTSSKGECADCTERVFDKIAINEEYIIPTNYLTSSKPLDSESWKKEIHRNSVLLKNTLAEFGIEAEVVNVNRGPVITLYEMQIAPGIKVNRVVGLADDIAMALAAQRVRIVAPIPGKSAIGVEIPNLYRETVTLGDIVKSEEFRKYEGSLVVALGKDILGKPVMLDLKRQPHLLIAGTTGSGKSVCVNSIITSLIYNYEPNYLRFILVDPKMVELQLYNGLPHLLTPVIVDPQVAPMVLKWTMHEMERRYSLLSAMNTRDIERYNDKVKRLKDGTEQLPYIVVIIDEMADLMMSSKEVEGYITRIAQKSRAVGIHLVVATQRPSVDIITGLIKANFPARIAFQVAQKTDSRTIIDQNGAEKLLGRGDMLYQSPTSSFPMRIQGGYISEEETEKIATHLCRLGRPSYIDIEESLLEDEDSKEIDEASDELFQEALKIIEETKKASASYLQRRLSIGYNRAARIIEQMEDMGYIGPQIGSKPREVFI